MMNEHIKTYINKIIQDYKTNIEILKNKNIEINLNKANIPNIQKQKDILLTLPPIKKKPFLIDNSPKNYNIIMKIKNFIKKLLNKI